MGAANVLAVHFIAQYQDAGLRVVHEPPVGDLENVYDFPFDMDNHEGFFNRPLCAVCRSVVLLVHLHSF